LNNEPFIVIVTGLSGGGKTVTLRTLEDMGFFCVDNLPPPLILNFLEMLEEYSKIKNVAFGMDIRIHEFFGIAHEVIKKVRQRYKTEVLFLEADEETIMRRYKETRRPHPLLTQYEDLLKAIKQENIFLYPLREISDRILDTSSFNPHELKLVIRSIYGENYEFPLITIISFGYKKGVPVNADMVFDVRFLPNPYFIPSLTHLSGKDASVKDFVLKQKETEEFLMHIKNFLNFLIPKYKKEGRAYLTIAIGCTGGKHRSVVIAEYLAEHLEGISFKPHIVHRDL
jgi:UPF0042 nucleotide-binding protein